MQQRISMELSLRRDDWELLPFRFHRFDDQQVLLTNLVGEHLFLPSAEFERLTGGSLGDQSVLRRLRGKHFIRHPDEDLPVELLAMKLRTRNRRLPEFTGLHIFVVTLRCDHSCPYCQVSRQTADTEQYDMSAETAQRALEMTFRSPSSTIKIEFQGGEPLLNLPLIEHIVDQAKAMNTQHGKNLAFVIATNLALLDDDVLHFAAKHDIQFSTSLDGPEDLHNKNRPRPGRDSWQRAVNGIRRIQQELGADRVSALMTTTEASLPRVKDIIDSYVEQGLFDVFLRPMSPYGFAVRNRSHARYDVERWIEFYEEGLEYILELNRLGIPVVERFAAIILRKMLSNDDPGYVDLMSPAGIGVGALVYNYDGHVYASDEGRMLAEMGDTTFCLGNLHTDSYQEIVTGDRLLDPLEASFAQSAPMCSDCAFEPFCGADPVFHHATAGDFVGRKPDSAFCTRNMAVFKMLLNRYSAEPATREVFRRWART
jgi:His-Xaa-Ser system radical SAM maturase HxsB